MKRALLFAVFVFSSVCLAKAPSDWTVPPTFDIRQPTVIAFFPLTKAEANAEGNEALSDFQYYLMVVEKRLQKSGIRVEQSYAESFSVRVGLTVTRFRPKDRQSGYYFIAPGRSPHVEYGVMTDVDLPDVAQKIFVPATK